MGKGGALGRARAAAAHKAGGKPGAARAREAAPAVGSLVFKIPVDGEDAEMAADEQSFLKLLGGDVPPPSSRMLEEDVQLKTNASSNTWRTYSLVLTPKYLIICKPSTEITQSRAPAGRAAEGPGEDHHVLDAIPLSQVLFCEANADSAVVRLRRSQQLIADKLWKVGGSAIADTMQNTDKDQFIVSTQESGFNAGRKFVFRCNSKRDCRKWTREIGENIKLMLRASSFGERVEYYRQILRKVVNSAPFQCFIALLIVVNFVLSVVDTELRPTPTSMLGRLFEDLEIIFTALFTIEVLLNFTANFFWDWFRDSWNIFDAAIVVISIAADATNELPSVTVLRLARVFRVIRLFKRLKGLRTIVNAITASMVPVGNSLFILALVSFVYAILGVRLYSDRDAANFGSFTVALLSMLQVCTGEGWGIGRPLYENNGNLDSGAVVFFISYLILVGIILVNIVLAVLVDEFIKSVGEEKAAEARLEEQRRLDSDFGPKKHEACLEPLLKALASTDSKSELHQALSDLFCFLDVQGTGEVSFHELLLGFFRMTANPGPWRNGGKIFFCRRSYLQFTLGLVDPDVVGMDINGFRLAMHRQIQVYLQRQLTEGAYMLQDRGLQGLVLTMKHVKMNLDGITRQELMSSQGPADDLFPVISQSSLSTTPVNIPLTPSDTAQAGGWSPKGGGAIEGVPSKGASPSSSPYTFPDPRRAVEDRNTAALWDCKGPNAEALKQIVSDVIESKLASFEANMAGTLATLLQTFKDDVTQEMQAARDRVAAAGDEQHAKLMQRTVALEDSMAHRLREAVSEGQRLEAETRLNDRRDRQMEREREREIGERERERDWKYEREREKDWQQYSYERRQTSSAKSEGQRAARGPARGGERRSENHGSSLKEGLRSSDHGSIGGASRGTSNSPRKSWSSGVSWSKRGDGESMREREREIKGAGDGGGLMWTSGRHVQNREMLGPTREISGSAPGPSRTIKVPALVLPPGPQSCVPGRQRDYNDVNADRQTSGRERGGQFHPSERRDKEGSHESSNRSEDNPTRTPEMASEIESETPTSQPTSQSDGRESPYGDYSGHHKNSEPGDSNGVMYPPGEDSSLPARYSRPGSPRALVVSPRFMGRNGADGRYNDRHNRDNAHQGVHRALSPRLPVQDQYDRDIDAHGGDEMPGITPGLQMGSALPEMGLDNGGGKEISSAPQASSSRFGFMQALQSRIRDRADTTSPADAVSPRYRVFDTR